MTSAPHRSNNHARIAAQTVALLESLHAASADSGVDGALRGTLEHAAALLRYQGMALKAERKRYRTLFDALPDPITIVGLDGTVLDANHAVAQLYRRAREEIIGQPLRALNPDLPGDHMRPLLQTLARGETYVNEIFSACADGSRVPVQIHSAGVDYEGHPAIVALARDISARHYAERRFDQLFQAIDKGVLVQDIETGAIHANPAALRIFEVPAGEDLDEIFREEHWTLLDEHGRPIPPEQMPHRLGFTDSSNPHSAIYGLLHKQSRKLRWLSTATVPVFADAGEKPRELIWIFSDVTELKRDSALFDRAQALAHIGGWEWEAASDRLYLTEEAHRILGQTHAPCSMRDFQRCLRPCDAARLKAVLDDVREHGLAVDLELQGIRHDKHPFWVRMIGQINTEGAGALSVSGTLQDILERKQAEETLRVQARTDPLTSLLNRDALLSELAIRLDDPTQSSVAVLYIDLDRFKLINDMLGHAAGDTLLYSAAQRIQQAVGTQGLTARFGGDEFIVACSYQDDLERPAMLAQAILDAFAPSFRFGKEEFAVSASIGVACAPQHGERAQQLIQNADMAMYASKRKLRNCWQFFTPDLAQSQQERLRMESQLRRAIDNNEFHLVYQPQVDLRNGGIIAAEALIRWENRQLGQMRPDHFIALAESSGDIVRIGNWVLQEACKQVAVWRDAGLGVMRVAVNVSYRQFVGADLAENVRQMLALYDLPGSALELEFTERVLIEDAPDTLRAFANLRAMGVLLTIDDFGEGYSALNYLRRLPIHGLKLSQLFVQGVPGNRSDVAVCQAVAGIARSLGLGLVAEGVESDAQRRFLLDIGVRIGQGWLYSPGLTADEFAQRIVPADLAGHG